MSALPPVFEAGLGLMLTAPAIALSFADESVSCYIPADLSLVLGERLSYFSLLLFAELSKLFSCKE